MSHVVRIVRVYDIELPDEGTPEREELATILFQRGDISTGFFDDQMMGVAMVYEGIAGNEEYPGWVIGWDAEKKKGIRKVLATVYETVLNGQQAFRVDEVIQIVGDEISSLGDGKD